MVPQEGKKGIIYHGIDFEDRIPEVRLRHEGPFHSGEGGGGKEGELGPSGREHRGAKARVFFFFLDSNVF